MSLILPDTLSFNCFTREFKGEEVLSAAEKSLISRWSTKRIRHFSTGRFCARNALKMAGVQDADILIGTSREPLWPEGLIGSISHSDTLCGAVVSNTSWLRAIGMDIEGTGKVEAEMWNLIYLPSEQDYLRSLTEKDQNIYTSLLFSMKESFYKLQFPLTKTFLEFTDVEIIQNGSQFELKVIKNFPAKAILPTTTPIYSLEQGDQLITYCYLE